MSWFHELLDGKGAPPRGAGERQKRERQTDGHEDRHAHTEAGRRRGEGRKVGWGGTRIAVLGWARRLRGACPGRRGCRRGAVHQSPAPAPGEPQSSEKVAAPTPAPAPTCAGGGTATVDTKQPCCWR